MFSVVACSAEQLKHVKLQSDFIKSKVADLSITNIQND